MLLLLLTSCHYRVTGDIPITLPKEVFVVDQTVFGEEEIEAIKLITNPTLLASTTNRDSNVSRLYVLTNIGNGYIIHRSIFLSEQVRLPLLSTVTYVDTDFEPITFYDLNGVCDDPTADLTDLCRVDAHAFIQDALRVFAVSLER